MHKIKWVFFAIGLMLLAGCTAKPTLTALLPTTQILRIDVTPATTWMIPKMDTCQKATAGLNLTVHEVYTRQLIPNEADLLILSGQPDLDNSYAVEIGKTELIFIVNPANSIQDISVEMLKQIFSGQIYRWSDVDPTLPDEIIQIWMPPTGDEVWDALDAYLLDWRSASPSAYMVSDPIAMLAGVSNDKYAIGVLPKIFLDQSVKAIGNQPEIPISIIAVTKSEPAGLIREFLLCLQATIPS